MSRAVLALLGAALLAANGASGGDASPEPWFTGPLLVPGTSVAGRGGGWLQPYLSIGEGLGVYNNGLSVRGQAPETTLNFQLLAGYGITDQLEVQLDTQVLWNHEGSASSAGFGDTAIELHWLFFDEDPGGWRPALRGDYVQAFPSGRYDRLDPAASGTDIRGSGSFAPSLAVNLTKTFHLGGHHFLRPAASVIYTLPLDVRVRELNAYGGGQGTDGTVHPGNAWILYLSGEYSLTRHWAVALDTTYAYADAWHFTGDPGVQADGTPASVGVPAGYQITVSPQLEYNFDDSQGIVLGPWVTVAGHHTQQFFTFVVTYAVSFDVPLP